MNLLKVEIFEGVFISPDWIKDNSRPQEEAVTKLS